MNGARRSELEIEIVKRFASLGYQVQPDAVELLMRYSERGVELDELSQRLANSLKSSTTFVISSDQIAEILKLRDSNIAPPPDIIKSFNRRDGKNSDFLAHFISRYDELSGIIKKRLSCSQIRAVRNMKSGDEVSVVGMVSSVNRTARGNLLVDLEDPSGHIPVVMPHNNEIIPDEVIGITGVLSESGYLFAHRVVYPDIPIQSSSQTSLPLTASSSRIYAVFISDMHVGSKTFREDAWYSFVDWLNEISERINIGYLLIAGDIVDGIGVYPGQESDLAIMDIEEQYRTAARCLSSLPDGIHVVISPGNHDAVRSAEPQPPLHTRFQRLFPDFCFVSNPAYVKVGNRVVLIYHGQSFDDFVNSVSRLNYSKPEEMMIEMLRRRHVAPIYGNSVSIYPNGHDYGVINPIPDIIHCGHTHTVGMARYRNVLALNSGTWQSQTEYQKKRGITPVVGCAILVELTQLKTKVVDFNNNEK